MPPTKPDPTTFSFETMAVVLCCALQSGVVLGDRHYQLMSALDGTRSANAFAHQFRKVKARARALLHTAAAADAPSPVPGKPRKKTAAAAAAAAAAQKKRGWSAMEEDDGDDEEESGGQESPLAKKAKVTEVEWQEDAEGHDDGLLF